jgi:hypothetical protein
MARDVQAVGIAAEAARVPVDPGDRATHLVGHRHHASAHVLDRGEVRHDEVGTGAHEQLGGKRIVLGEAGAPRDAVDEDVDRRVGAHGRVEVEALDLRRGVCEAPRRAEPCAGGVALDREAWNDLLAIRRPHGLVVGRVQLGLIEIESHTRGPLTRGPGCRSPKSVNRRAALRPRARCLERGRGLQDRQVGEATADDLEADGQSGQVKPAGTDAAGWPVKLNG